MYHMSFKIMFIRCCFSRNIGHFMSFLLNITVLAISVFFAYYDFFTVLLFFLHITLIYEIF